jgi:ATP-dependent RNA helicase HrpB
MTAKPPLPIDDVLGALSRGLESSRNAVLIAEPGAGKTTRVPLALLEAPWLKSGRILMLEPRRVAARAAARFMAKSLDEDVGGTVGYRVRFDSRISAKTRIEIVTEGVLTRKLAADPLLRGVGLLIFDEFHERSLEADVALALALEIQEALKPDLKLLVMSATLEAEDLAEVLGKAPIFRSRGRRYPVETFHLGRATRRSVATDVAEAARTALNRHEGSVLVFLPGEAEIRRAEAALSSSLVDRSVEVLPLHGSLSPAAQDRAIAPALAGRRKAVLATTIAETSLTIEGVSIVIDGGFKRAPRFDPGSGMTRLETVRVSAAAAEQRRGRAGRLGPGVCYRLWPEAEMLALAPQDTPEILLADLAPFVLELANAGISDPSQLKLVTPPPAGALAQAKELLLQLGAIDRQGLITPHGKEMVELPLHPRLAHMVVKGKELRQGALAADIAALLEERDVLAGQGDANIASRLELLRRDKRFLRAKLAAEQIRRIARIKPGDSEGHAGELLALAYSERIAQARDKRGSYRMASGQGAMLEETDGLAREKFLAVGTTDGNSANARIFLAAPLNRNSIESLFSDQIATRSEVRWDKRAQAVSAKIERRLGALVLDEQPIENADADVLAEAMLQGVKSLGLEALPWSEKARALRSRVMTMRGLEPQGSWPDLSDEALRHSVELWLKPFLHGKTRRQHLAAVDMARALGALLPAHLLRRLDELLPERVKVPSGSEVVIDYAGESPVARVKLQELFGAKSLPPLAKGQLKLKIELLSPAGRPLAVTQDLASFWANAYAQVRAEMRGRYPKHFWPEDPLTALPSRGPKRRGSA